MTARQSPFRPTIESLEDRCVPTTARLADGILNVVGPASSGAVDVALSRGTLKVSGVHRTFRACAVHEIDIHAGAGNEFIDIDARLSTPVVVYCGPGRETILGGAGTTTIIGGGGHAVFFSRGGPQAGLALGDEENEPADQPQQVSGSFLQNAGGIAGEAARLVGSPEIPPGQCTDLVQKVLRDNGYNADFGINGHNAEGDPNYTWGTLVYSRYVYSGSGYDSAGVSGSLANVLPDDVIQFADYRDANNSADHHTAIVVAPPKNGDVLVVQQHVGSDTHVEYGTFHVSNMSQGTVWVYRPQFNFTPSGYTGPGIFF
jgi:hypothetical protein